MLMFFLCILSFVATLSSITNVESSFKQLLDGTPLNVIDDVISIEREMIKILLSFESHNDINFVIDKVDEDINLIEKNGTIAGYSLLQDLVKIDVHVDVVFVGFPSQSIDIVRGKWFSSLGRNDKLMAMLGPSGEIIVVPGGGSIRLHFHLVQISFHVVNALQERIQKFLRPLHKMSNFAYYLNTWEVETLLLSLSHDIGISLAQNPIGDYQILPSTKFTTFFILNINLNDPSNTTDSLTNYTYLNGFSPQDYEELSKKEDVRNLAKMILDSEKTVKRFEKERDPKANPILSHSLKVPIPSAIDPDSPKLVHWRDAIKFTRTWATTFQEETKMLQGKLHLHDRAVAILSSLPGAPLGAYRVPLAKAILDRDRGIDANGGVGCTASTWVSHRRMVWSDIRASADTPVQTIRGRTHRAPAPRELNETEWKRIGERPGEEVLLAHIAHSFKSLQSQQSTLSALLSQMNCPLSPSSLSATPSDPAKASVALEDIATQLKRLLNSESAYSRKSCVSMLFQRSLIHVISTLSAHLSKAHQHYLQSAQRDQLAPYLHDAATVHNLLLNATLSLSGGILDSSQLDSSTSSAETNVYLGHLVAFALRLARHVITPPMQLRAPLSWSSQTVDTSTSLRRTGLFSGESLYEVVTGRNGNDAHSTRAMETRRWMTLNPPLLFPSHVDIVIYVIRIQNLYEPIERNHRQTGIDTQTLINELSRLQLANQRISISIQTVDMRRKESGGERADEEIGLALALTGCQRRSVSPRLNMDGQVLPSRRLSLDSHCVLSLVQHYDAHEAQTADSDESSLIRKSQLQHLPVFLISLATSEPTYLDDGFQAVNLGAAVLGVQNYQQRIPSDLRCGQDVVTLNGRNIVGPVLMAVGEAIGGLAPGHIAHRGAASASVVSSLLNVKVEGVGSRLHDWSTFCGSSPVFDAYAQPRFGDLDIDFIHRSRALRALSLARQLATNKLMAGFPIAKASPKLVNLYLEKALAAMSICDWADSAAYTNAILLELSKCHE